MSYRQRRTRTLFAAAVLAVATTGATVPAAIGQEPANVVAAAPATAVPGFLIQTSAQVSDDSAVSKPGRPLIPEQERAELDVHTTRGTERRRALDLFDRLIERL